MMTCVMEEFWKEGVVDYDFDSPDPPKLTRPNEAQRRKNKKGGDAFYTENITPPGCRGFR